MKRQGKLAFISGGMWLAHLPMVVELIRALELRGWVVDVYNTPPSDTVPVSPAREIPAYPRGRIWPWRMALHHACRHPYSGYIGSKDVGITCASLLGKASRRPVAFMSDELLVHEKRMNHKPSWPMHTAFTIVPDLCRWGHLRDQYGFPACSKVYELPNAPRKAGNPADIAAFRSAWGVGKGELCLLSIGGISDRYGVGRFFAAIPDATTKVKVVVHDRVTRDDSYKAMARLLEQGNPRLHFSLSTVEYDLVPSLAGAGDIGIALYDGGQGPWTALMGKASGKIAYFLANGVPVIHEDFDNLRYITEAGAGIGVHDPASITAALTKIVEDLPGYRTRARALFDARLRPDEPLAAICDEIEGWRRK